MELVTAAQMQGLDRLAIDQFKIPSLQLMEQAGKNVAEIVRENLTSKNGAVAIVVGKGNNAGDGLVVARYLKEWGIDVVLFVMAEVSELSADAAANWRQLEKDPPHIISFTTEDNIRKNAVHLRESALIVDAIFGTGLNAELTGKYRLAIEAINKSVKPVVAIDVPSGISADSGHVLGAAVRARVTVTFQLPKLGLVISPGSEYTGRLRVVDIGIPKAAISSVKTPYHLSSPDLFRNCFASRDPNSHKGSFGHVLVVAGSSGKMGAGLLTSRGVLRCGAGLVTYALPQAAFDKYDSRFPEIMVEGIADGGRGYFDKQSAAGIAETLAQKSVVAIGPGIGTNPETKQVVLEIISKTKVPLIIDADGLNNIAGELNILGRRQAPTILTPHPGEMSHLTGATTKDVQERRLELALKLAKSANSYVVLKGHRSLVATPDGQVFINPTGNPGMATAGMGDVLTGVIAGFIAQGIPVDIAVVAAVYIHGMAGDMAAEAAGEIGLLASDVIEQLPKVINIMCHSE